MSVRRIAPVAAALVLGTASAVLAAGRLDPGVVPRTDIAVQGVRVAVPAGVRARFAPGDGAGLRLDLANRGLGATTLLVGYLGRRDLPGRGTRVGSRRVNIGAGTPERPWVLQDRRLLEVRVPSGFGPGPYRLTVCAQPLGAATDRNPGDNCLIAPAGFAVVLPPVSLTAEQANLGTVAVGATVTGSIRFTNPGPRTTQVLPAAQPAGRDAAELDLIADECIGRVLTAGESCQVVFTLTPRGPGPRQLAIGLGPPDDELARGSVEALGVQ